MADSFAAETPRMFAETPPTPSPGTGNALAALVGGNALIPPPMAEPVGVSTTQPASSKKPEDVRGMVKNQDFIIYSLVLAGLLLLAAVIFFFFDRWRKRPIGDSARDVSLSLGSFKEMYENGELTEAEYERIKAKWAAKMKEKVGVPNAPPVPPAVPTPPPEPPTA